jgi:hypothetical protein
MLTLGGSHRPQAALAFCTLRVQKSQNRPDSLTISPVPTRGLKGERMSTPPEQPSRTGTYGYQPGTTLDIARLPIPGNAELFIYVVVLVIFALIAIFDNQVSADRFVWGATWVTVGYFVSRGLAKATRVLEQ